MIVGSQEVIIVTSKISFFSDDFNISQYFHVTLTIFYSDIGLQNS
jgi:hypothetical protein